MERKTLRNFLTLLLILVPLTLLFYQNVCAYPLPLSDTGQTKCYNNTGEITCPQPGADFYGQDGNYAINPPSYTKLGATGNDLPNSATSWSMVRDNVTGLIWEVKTDDGSIHDKDNEYGWYDSNPETNGGDAGWSFNEKTTENFIQTLNTASFGGHSDWHSPTIKELISIIDLAKRDLATDSAFFPNTRSSNYWSSTTYAEDISNVLYVGFGAGSVSKCVKLSFYPFRCVRGGASQSFDSLIINGDGTVADPSTGLMWQQATSPDVYNWENALSYSESLTLAGYDDWRLPNRKELLSIVDYRTFHPSIDTYFFPDTKSSWYWSSSTFEAEPTLAWHGDFNYGCGTANLKTNNYYVRCVRSGQPPTTTTTTSTTTSTTTTTTSTTTSTTTTTTTTSATTTSATTTSATTTSATTTSATTTSATTSTVSSTTAPTTTTTIPSAPTMSIGSGSGESGGQITLPIEIANQSGTLVAAASVDIGYDGSVFEKPSAVVGPAAEAVGKEVATSDMAAGLFRVSILSGSNNDVIGNGVIAYLTLKVQTSAPIGLTTLTTTASGSDSSGDSVVVNGSNGTVTIIGDVPGDCNGDGTVSIAEVQSAINMFLGINAIEDCVDVNGNGKVSIGEVQKIINKHLRLSASPGAGFISWGNSIKDSNNLRGSTSPILMLGQGIGDAGETITVPVTLSNVSGYDISAISSDITYDTNVLETPTVEIGPAGTDAGKTVNSNEPTSGTLRIGVLSVSNNNAIGSGVVAYVTFTVKTASGRVTLGNSAEASDPSGNDVSLNGTNGSIIAAKIVYVDSSGECGGNGSCFSGIQNAIDSATGYFLMRLSEGIYDEDIVIDQTYGLTLSGGWDSTFTSQSSETVINSLTISDTSGTVEAENIALQ